VQRVANARNLRVDLPEDLTERGGDRLHQRGIGALPIRQSINAFRTFGSWLGLARPPMGLEIGEPLFGNAIVGHADLTI
jgi:hypothetical protein